MKVEQSITIPADRDLIWEVAHNPALRPEWDVRVAGFTVDGAPEAGAAATIVWRAPVLRPTAEAEYRTFQFPERSTMYLGPTNPPLFYPGTLTWTFAEARNGTRVTIRFDLDRAAVEGEQAPNWLFRLLMSRDTKRSLKRLRTLAVEKGRELAAEGGFVSASRTL